MISRQIDHAEIQARWNLAEIGAASANQRKALVHCAIWQALDRRSWESFKRDYRTSPASHQMTVITRNARRLFATAIAADFDRRGPEFIQWVERVAEYRPQPSFLKRTPTVGTSRPMHSSSSLAVIVESRFYSYSKWIASHATRPFSPKICLFDDYSEHPAGASSSTRRDDRVEINTATLASVRDYLSDVVSGSESILGIDLLYAQSDRAQEDHVTRDTNPPARRSGQLTPVQTSCRSDRLQSALELAALDFIMLHELGHIYCGHCDLRDSRLLAGKPLSLIERQALDFDADIFAATALLKLCLGKGISLFSLEDMSFLQIMFESAFSPNAGVAALAMFSGFSTIDLGTQTIWSFEAGEGSNFEHLAQRTGTLAYAFISALSKAATTVDQAASFTLDMMKGAREVFAEFGGRRGRSPTLGDEMIDRSRDLLSKIEDLAPELRFFERGKSFRFDLRHAA